MIAIRYGAPGSQLLRTLSYSKRRQGAARNQSFANPNLQEPFCQILKCFTKIQRIVSPLALATIATVDGVAHRVRVFQNLVWWQPQNLDSNPEN